MNQQVKMPEPQYSRVDRVRAAQKAIMVHAEVLGIEQSEATLADELVTSLREFSTNENFSHVPMNLPQNDPIACEILGELIDYSTGRSGLRDFYPGKVDRATGRLSLDRADREVSLYVKGGTPFCGIRVGSVLERYPVTAEGVAVLTNDAIKALIDAIPSEKLVADGSERKVPVAMRQADPAGAKQFFSELLDSVETLSGIADQYGSRTLADLMFLQNAIASGGFIDHYPDGSSVGEVVKELPSADRWMKYVALQYLEEKYEAPSPHM
ncbi:hypothetical protein A8H39_01225 [Paraburkholderia fungorum]|uniref:hypothetical protein n=1 Tax=Paraburkholderia fungorum TaxID=134537 RepID=UPI000695A612|nr:hypothetical protein [Paraburkholderia fungorum]PNE59797.1 hypothetical protein A8H39_01225 [Paraburkholderia fungorum]